MRQDLRDEQTMAGRWRGGYVQSEKTAVVENGAC